MDLAWICASLSRFREMSVLWKTSVFSIFSWPHRKIFQVAANRTILKIDALHIAHIEADVPLVEFSDTSKIVGPSPLRSQKIGNHDRQKECFLTTFWEKMVCFTKLTPWTPPSVIHGWKATDLLYEMVKRKNYLLNPISRQNFADALAENHNLKLEVCLI